MIELALIGLAGFAAGIAAAGVLGLVLLQRATIAYRHENERCLVRDMLPGLLRRRPMLNKQDYL